MTRRMNIIHLIITSQVQYLIRFIQPAMSFSDMKIQISVAPYGLSGAVVTTYMALVALCLSVFHHSINPLYLTKRLIHFVLQ